ncbi:HPr kinase/phosphorylase [Sphingobium sp. OAS761]|uniref:HPr kinase/phosphorylase n=1 Tax=Sphingobium sp. OAS761 TaxID=2817901 RepID=UPI00209E68D7|nr:aldolase [Sphingobium sp. OAS761]
MARALSSETLHATSVAVDGLAILLCGPSGAGKSDLALRLIDRGASLVSDDYTLVKRIDGRLVACSPDSIAGRMEVRGVGIVAMPHVGDVPVTLLVDLTDQVERLPVSGASRIIAGIATPVAQIVPFEASAAIKVELALRALTG